MKSKKVNPQFLKGLRTNPKTTATLINLKTQNLLDNFRVNKQNHKYLRMPTRNRKDPFGYIRLRKQSKKLVQPISQRSFVKLPKSLKKSKKMKLASGFEIIKRNPKLSYVETSLVNNRAPVLTLFPAKENNKFKHNVLPPINPLKLFKKAPLHKTKSVEPTKRAVSRSLQKKTFPEDLEKALSLDSMLEKLRIVTKEKGRKVFKKRGVVSKELKREKEEEEAQKKKKDFFVGLWKSKNKPVFHFENQRKFVGLN